MSKETRYFWNKTGECFAGKTFGEDITEYFSGDINDKGAAKEGTRLENFLKFGSISDEKPVCYEAAEDAELNQLRETVENQKGQIADFQRELDSVPENITAAKKEAKELKSEIEELQRQISELTEPSATEPKGKGGK